MMVQDERYWKGVSDLCAMCARKPVRDRVVGFLRQRV